MRSFLHTTQSKLYRWLASPACFYTIASLAVVQGLWIALSAQYPQAFDENFHFGLIQLHAQQWLPWFSSQPAGADIYGAVVRDPSYLYQYLLSWPYRLLAIVTDSTALQVIGLRLINIGLFTAGLFAYRSLFNELTVPQRIQNVVFLFFILIPIVPLLTGQINYDNFIFLISGLLFLYCVRIMHRLQDAQPVPLVHILLVVLLGMIGSLSKYAFAPLFLGVTVVLISLFVQFRRRSPELNLPASRLVVGLRRNVVSWLLVIAVICVGSLFIERYGVNMLRYHNPSPDCGDVLTVDQCRQYAPWGRDYVFARIFEKPTTGDVAGYPLTWFHHMMRESMFTITSHFAANGTVDYYGAQPLPVAYGTAWLMAPLGLALTVLHTKKWWRLAPLRLVLLIAVFYVLVLFLKNVAMFLYAGKEVAIHGRYLVPVFPLLLLILVLSFGWTLDKLKLSNFKSALMVVALLLFLQGGSVTTWILRSQTDWYWPDNQAAQQSNRTAQSALRPVIVE